MLALFVCLFRFVTGTCLRERDREQFCGMFGLEFANLGVGGVGAGGIVSL